MKPNYYSNDPGTPDLVERVTLPAASSLTPIGLYRLEEALGAEFEFGTEQSQALMCAYTIRRLLAYLHARPATSRLSWFGKRQLEVHPRGLSFLNACYGRMFLNLGYDKVNGTTVFAADSADLVAHETGHAVLDGLRADLWNVGSVEVISMHEATADIVSFVSSTLSENVVDRAIAQTGGDLSQSNLLSRVGDYFGRMYYMRQGVQAPEITCCRDLSIPFKYQPPGRLPRTGVYNQLTSNPHAFSRIFTSYWYALFCAVYGDQLKQKPSSQAIADARDICFDAFVAAIISVPVNPFFMRVVGEQTAQRMGPYRDLAYDLLSQFNILPAIKSLAEKSKAVATQRVAYVRASDYILQTSSSGHPFYDSEIQVRNDPHQERLGRAVVATVGATEEELIQDGILAAHIAATHADDWDIVSGRLHRKQI